MYCDQYGIKITFSHNVTRPPSNIITLCYHKLQKVAHVITKCYGGVLLTPNANIERQVLRYPRCGSFYDTGKTFTQTNKSDADIFFRWPFTPHPAHLPLFVLLFVLLFRLFVGYLERTPRPHGLYFSIGPHVSWYELRRRVILAAMSPLNLKTTGLANQR